MNYEKRKLYLLSIFIPACLFFVLFTPSAVCRLSSAVLLALAAAAVLVLIKKRSIPSIHHRQVAGLLAVFAVLYGIVTYTAGVWVGFYRNASALSANNLFFTVLPIVAILIATELIRSVLLSQKSRVASAMAYLLGILAELAMAQGIAGVTGMTQFMDLVGLTLFPAVTFGLLYQHLSARYGARAVIIFRLLMTLPLYLLPITPAIPEVITAFVLNLMPFGIRMFIDLLYAKKQKYATRKPKKLSYVSLAATFLLLTSLVMLISGQFAYKLLVIATPSMTGALNQGDAIIYEEYDGDTIEEGDIVVFSKDGTTLVVHRVIGIDHYDGVTYYTTKGDANPDADDGYITQKHILGVVQLKLPYLGQTSLWLRELFA